MQMAKILLAEDDSTMVSLLKTLLNMEGFDVVALDAASDVAAEVEKERLGRVMAAAVAAAP